MSVSMNDEDFGSEENALIVVNPIHRGIGDYVDDVATLTQVYDGKTFRVSNIDYINDPGEAVGHYDDSFLIDENGLDSIDTRELSRQADIFDFAGGPLADIASVYHDLDRESIHSYDLMGRVVYDYGAVAGDGTVINDDLERVDNLLEWDEDSTRARFERKGIQELFDTL